MTFEEFWQSIVAFGHAGRQIPNNPNYHYWAIIENGHEKLKFSSGNAQNEYRILKAKVEEYFHMLNENQVEVAWFKRNRSYWFYEVFRDVNDME